MSGPFSPCCPSCGHAFTLFDLSRMAMGDGWQRYADVSLADGRRAWVAFQQINHRTMRPFGGNPKPFDVVIYADGEMAPVVAGVAFIAAVD